MKDVIKKIAFGLRILEKRGLRYIHGYDPRQLNDYFLVLSCNFYERYNKQCIWNLSQTVALYYGVWEALPLDMGI